MNKILVLTVFVISALLLYSCTTEESVTVTLYLEGNQLGDTLQFDKGDKIMIPCAQKDGYTLDGWYTSSAFNNKWSFEVDEVEEDLSLYARWIPIE